MSQSIDERVVEMRFNNSQFEQNAQKSLNTLDRLKKSLNLDKSVESFDNLRNISRDMSLLDIASGVDYVSNRFSALGVVGMTILQNLTTSALNFGKSLLTAIPRQIITGGKTRALNIEQAKFQLSGLGIAWEDIYDNIDKAVSGTAYGLDEAAKVASQLAASGIAYGDAESTMAHALRGISGVAAMTNSSYEDIGSIFTTVAGQSKLMTFQLRQLESRGLNAAAQLGKVLGKSESDIRDMVTKGKIDFETFSKAMDDAFGEHATAANETFTGAFANMKAALSRIGADFAAPYMNAMREVYNALRLAFNRIRTITKPFAEGVFTDLTKRWSDIAVNEISKWKFGWLNSIVQVSEKMFNFLRLLGIGTALKSIRNIAKAIINVLSPIGEAFKETFSPISTNVLNKYIRSFDLFTRKLKITAENSQNLKIIFKGLFSIFKLIGQAITTVVKSLTGFQGLFTKVGLGASNILKRLASVGSWFIALSDAAEKGNVFAIVLERLRSAFKTITDTFSFNGFSNVGKSLGSIFKSLTAIVDRFVHMVLGAFDGTSIFSLISSALQGFFTVLGENTTSFRSFLTSGISLIGDVLEQAWDTFARVLGKIKESMGGKSVFEMIVAAVNTLVPLQTFFAGKNIFDIMSAAIGTLMSGLMHLGTLDLVNAIKKRMFNLTETMRLTIARWDVFKGRINGMLADFRMTWFRVSTLVQTNLSMNVLKTFATSIAIISASLLMLSLVDADRLVPSLQALLILLGSMAMVSKVLSTLTFVDKSFGYRVAAALIGLALSVSILAGALKRVASIPNPMSGLIPIIGLIAMLTYATTFLPETQIAKSAVALIGLALGVSILSKAVIRLANSGGNIPDSLISVGGLLFGLAAFMTILGGVNFNVGSGIGLIGLAASLSIITNVLTKLGELDSGVLTQGLHAMSRIAFIMGALSAIVSWVGSNAGSAVSFMVISASIMMVSSALRSLSSSGGNIDGAVTAIFGVSSAMMLLMAVGKRFGVGSLAILAMSVALGLITTSLIALSLVPLDSIMNGVIAIGMAFGVLGIAGVALAPLAPVLLILSAALILISSAIAIASVAIFALGAAFSALAVGGVAAATAFISSLKILITGLIDMNSVIIMGVISLITSVATAIMSSAGVIVESVLSVIDQILAAIVSHAPSILSNVLSLILILIGAISSAMPAITNAGLNLILSFFNGMAEAIRTHGPELLAAIANLVSAIIEFVLVALESIVRLIPGVGGKIAESLDAFKGQVRETLAPESLEGISEESANGLAQGFANSTSEVTAEAGTLGEASVSALEQSVPSFEAIGNDAGDGFATGLSNSFGEFDFSSVFSGDTLASMSSVLPEFNGIGLGAAGEFTAGVSQGNEEAMVAGSGLAENAITGLGSKKSSAASAGSALASSGASGAHNQHSNFFNAGGYVGQGFIDGIISKELESGEAGKRIAKAAYEAAKKELEEKSPSKKFRELGIYGTEGFIIGLSSLSDSVEDTAQLLALSAIDPVTSAMKRINELIDDNLEYSPVVTPVLDLTGVEHASSMLNSMLGSNSSIMADAAYEYGLDDSKIDTLISVGNRILDAVQRGQVIYLDGDVVAGSVNQRLGLL